MIDPELQRLARRRQNRRLALVLPLALVPLVVVIAWAAWQSSNGDVPPWGNLKTPRLLIFAAIPILIIAVELGVLLWLRRRGVRWLQPSPALGLKRRDRRRLLCAIRRGEPLPGRDGELARDLAQRLAQQQGWLIVALAAVVVLEVVLGVPHGSDAIDVLALVIALLAAVALPFAVRDVRRARRYLELEEKPMHRPEE